MCASHIYCKMVYFSLRAGSEVHAIHQGPLLHAAWKLMKRHNRGNLSLHHQKNILMSDISVIQPSSGYLTEGQLTKTLLIKIFFWWRRFSIVQESYLSSSNCHTSRYHIVMYNIYIEIHLEMCKNPILANENAYVHI